VAKFAAGVVDTGGKFAISFTTEFYLLPHISGRFLPSAWIRKDWLKSLRSYLAAKGKKRVNFNKQKQTD
jgi:hypothetical protein